MAMLNVCQARNRETIGPLVYPTGDDQAACDEVDFGVICGGLSSAAEANLQV